MAMIMDYEEKYNYVLGRAERLKKSCSLPYIKDWVDNVFPELRESEDERIRKGLIKAVSGTLKGNTLFGTDVTREEALAWLEKQGKQKPKKVPIWKHWKDGIAGNGEGEQIYLIKVGNTYNLSSCLGCECDYIELSELDNLLSDKQGEQKPADKVEPKFEIEKGKWYVCNTSRYTDFIVGKAYYCPKDGMLKPNENEIARYVARDCFHLWTIQDAKDGDVLACNEEILLFKSYSVQDRISLYCWYNGQTNNFHSKEVVETSVATGNKIYPATKEQRELLFQNMHEAGYEWDSKKKELRKIEKQDGQKNKTALDTAIEEEEVDTWLEKQVPKSRCTVIEDSYITPNKEFFQFIYDRLIYVHKENPNTDYMLSLKERISNMYYLEQSKSTFKASDWYVSNVDGKIHDMTYTPKNKDEQVNWTEEDEHHWMMCLECVEECATQKGEDFSKTIDWLKAIKQRLEGEITSKNYNKIIWLEDIGKMTKEDYMLLPKERLAEMLVAKNNEPPVINIPFQSTRLQCYEPGGICINPFRDCINCPRVFGDQSYTITTSQTILKDEK